MVYHLPYFFPGALEASRAEKMVSFSSKEYGRKESLETLNQKTGFCCYQPRLPGLDADGKESFLLFLNYTLKLELQDPVILASDLQPTALRVVKF